MNAAEGLVYKAAGCKNGFRSSYHFLVDQFAVDDSCNGISNTKPSGWINNGGRLGLPHYFALGNESVDLPRDRAALVLFHSGRKNINIFDGFNGGVAPGVLIFENGLNGLIQYRSDIHLNVTRADPRSLGCNQAVARSFGVFAHRDGLFFRSIGLLACGDSELGVVFNKQAGLFPATFHFGQLPAKNVGLIENAGGSSDNEKEREIFSKSLSAILAALFFAIGLTLPTDCINERNEIRRIAFWSVSACTSRP